MLSAEQCVVCPAILTVPLNSFPGSVVLVLHLATSMTRAMLVYKTRQHNNEKDS